MTTRTTSSLNRNILRLALPNIITNITVPLLGLVDLALMGHLGNPVYIGAIALGSVIFSLLYTGFGFLRMGTSGFTAQEFGAKSQEGMSLILWRSVLVGLGLGVLFILLQKPIEIIAFQILDGSNEVIELAKGYFRVRIWAAPATLGLYALYGWFLGMQDAKTPMIIAISINIINIVLDFVFVYWLNMTSEGVALASVIAQYSGIIIAFFILFNKYLSFTKNHALSILLDRVQIKKFFRVNADIFIRTLALMLTFTFFTAMSARMGDELLAVNSLMIQFLYIFSFFADGFAFAGEALVGKAHGANNQKLLKKTVNYLFKWGWAATLLVSVIYYFGFDLIMSALTNNTNLLQLSETYRWWVVILPITTIAAFIWDGIFIGITASKQMRNVMLMAAFLIFLPTYYLTINFIGNHSLWLSINLFMVVRGLIMWKASRGLVGKPKTNYS